MSGLLWSVNTEGKETKTYQFLFYLEEENKRKEERTYAALASPVPIPASSSKHCVSFSMGFNLPFSQLVWVRTKSTSGSKPDYYSPNYISLAKVTDLKIDSLPHQRRLTLIPQPLPKLLGRGYLTFKWTWNWRLLRVTWGRLNRVNPVEKNTELKDKEKTISI